MRGGRPVGVIADHALFDGDAGEFGDRDLDPRHLVPAQIGAHHQRDEAVPAPGVAQHAAAVGIADLDQRAERGQRRLEIAGLLGHDDDPIILPVIGERDAEAVEDAPARRRQQPQIDAVLVGKDGVAVLFEDLQLIHAAGEDSRRAPPGRRRGGRPAG